MELEYLDKTVRNLFDRLGAGNSHPGSGSAAALQGMVSAKMISTVISITKNSRKPQLFEHIIDQASKYQNDIEGRIFPLLTELFQKDSDQFELTIDTRKKRDDAKDNFEYNQHRRQGLEELKVCISLPLEIAELCIDLANIASFVFDNCVKKARGDSQVGLSGAVSALAGCISIIRLNILSYKSDEFNYSISVVEEVDRLDLVYQELNTVASEKIKILQEEFKAKIPLYNGIKVLLSKYKNVPKTNVDQCVRDLQNLIWNNRSVIWKIAPSTKLEILRPEIIFENVLGIDCFFDNDFGVPDENNIITEVAGVIDQPNKLAVISNDYPIETQRFTAAHELGHAILHNQSIVFRDTPANRAIKRGYGDFTEAEADKFATLFLMPRTIVLKEFERAFKLKKFILNDYNAFQFGGKSVSDIKKECKNLRGLTRKMADTDFFGGQTSVPLRTVFNVSKEAMAIRLEELNLVVYSS